MIKAVIIDDEPLARELTRAYLKAFPQIEVLEECNDGFEVIKVIQQHHPDLIFLDIQMPKINGFEMLELIDKPPAVIFATAFDEFAIKAFESNAIDYLLKPYSQDRFSKAVQKFLDKTKPVSEPEESIQKTLDSMAASPAQQNRLVVKTGTKVKIIPLHDIHYLEADDDYVKVITAEGQYLKNRTMQFYEDTLDSQQFVRVHRSYIVHVNQITRIDPYQKESYLAVLRNGKQIPVSKNGHTKLKSILGI